MGFEERLQQKLEDWNTVAIDNVESLFNRGHISNNAELSREEVIRQQFGQLVTSLSGSVEGGLFTPSPERFSQMINSLIAVRDRFNIKADTSDPNSEPYHLDEVIERMKKRLGYR